MVEREKEETLEETVEKKEEGQEQLTKEEKEQKEQEEILKKYEDSIFGRLFAYSEDKMGLFIIGIIFALANGTIFPLFSLFFAKLLNVLIKLYANSNDTDAVN